MEQVWPKSLSLADFGMAVFFEPGKLPRRDLGLEGTPWFMSPETLSSQVRFHRSEQEATELLSREDLASSTSDGQSSSQIQSKN